MRYAPHHLPHKVLAGEPIAPERSALMARVRSKNSKPEIIVRRLVHALRYRFRLHYSALPGTPDLAFPRLRKVIFVHGCFWHRHHGCARTTTPKTRAAYWRGKFAANVERDVRKKRQLKALGWGVLVVWECQTFDPDTLANRVTAFLLGRKPPNLASFLTSTHARPPIVSTQQKG